MSSEPQAITYAAAGVDVDAGDRAVELMKSAVAATHTEAVVGGLGGFAGLMDVSELTSMRRPLLATSTDGVGTKIAVARALDRHDTIGVDLVAMVVDDIVVSGARPLFMTDYIACGKVVPERIAAIVSGIADGCRRTGTALIGGETAEHPGLLADDEYDVAGAATGVVEADEVLGAHRVRDGDTVVGIASSGLHSNGYSLVRRVIADAGWSYTRPVAELDRTIGEELLEPTALYTLGCLAAAGTGRVHAYSHVTGGGLAANLARVLPQGLLATLDRGSWRPAPIFALIAELGRVPRDDLERTLNMGVGMVAVVAEASPVIEALAEHGHSAWVLGQVGVDDGDDDAVRGSKGVQGGAVRVVGSHPS